MFKSIQRSGRIAAVAIGLIAALSPLASPPAALAGGSVPTPELEKSYSFKTSGAYSHIGKSGDSMFGYLYDYDDDSNLKRITLINFNDGSSSPIAIPDKSLDSAYRTGIDQLYWIDGSNVVVFSPENQTQTVHPINSAKYAYTGVTVSDDGKRAAVEHYDYESELKKIEIYDLKSDKLIQTYQSDKDDSYFYYSDDMSRLYFLPYDTEKGVVSLRVFNCDTGSTELKTVNVKKDDRSSDIDHIVTSSYSDAYSDDIYLQSDTALIKADRDGNMSVVFNDDDHAPEWLYSNPSAEFYALYTKKGSNDLFDEDDGYYYLNEEDANLSVYDLNSDEIISSIAFPFGDGYLGGISHDGGILLGTYSDDDKSSACLVDAKTGAKSEFDSHCCSSTFMNGDREIWTDYYDEDDSSTLHVNIYKSNIPHSLPEDVLYFVQTHLPFVIGGGVAIVLIVGGVIVVLCIRKKRAKAANGAVAAAPKTQRKQRRRQKRAQRNAVPPAAPTMPAAPTEPARFCRHCGTPLVPEAQFCPTCGQKVD